MPAGGGNSSIYARLNLSSAIFPFYTEAAGRTIMLPEMDENFDRYNAANTSPDKGVPQVYYMHNVVPVAGGFQSIGYDMQLSGLPGVTNFDDCFPIINSSNVNVLFSPASGLNYIYDGTVGHWVSSNPITPGTVPQNVQVTTALVNGETYIYYANYGCYKYNSTTKALVSVTLTGLTMANILGICEGSGYLIAWTTNFVAWSSLTDPTNFIPSIQTGAGGASIQDARGAINFCASIPNGFLIYCEKNIVGASFTNNTSNPFIFSGVTGSGGVSRIGLVGIKGNLPYHVAFTTAGIQQVSLNSAIPTMPEVSDFLTAKIFEDFQEDTINFRQAYLTSPLNIKIASISNRYIVVSYGVTTPDFTHAIVYDIALNRYGKLKLLHRSAFEYQAPTLYGLVTFDMLMNTPISSLGDATYQQMFSNVREPITPKQNLAFMQADGTIQLVDFSVSEDNASGVFVIGKLQFRRSNMIVHQRTEVETVNAASAFKVWILPTFDGKDFEMAVPAIRINPGTKLTQTWAKKTTAQNISILLTGAFNLTSLMVNFTLGGSR